MSRVLGGVSVVVIGIVLIAMVLRIGFPLELEWMEGGMLHQAHRFAHGEPLYPPPGADFVPFLYTPGFAVLVGTLGKLFGVGFALGRLVSIVSCVAIGWAIWYAVREAGKPSVHGVAAIALFASSYVFTFRWLDLARPDTLAMALCVWALVLLQTCQGRPRRAVLAGVLMALSFWTKQTTATFVVASGIGALLLAPRQFPAYALTIAVIDGGGVLWGNAVTDGRLWHYIYELHQSHAFNDERFEKKTWGMFLHAGPFVIAAVLVSLAGLLRQLSAQEDRGRRFERAKVPLFWGVMAGTGLFVSALGYSTQWAEPNAFIPGVLMGAIALGVMMPTADRIGVVSAALVMVQLVFSLTVEPLYQPIQHSGWSALGRSYAWQRWHRTVPTSEAQRRAASLRASIEQASGPVFALQRPWWSVLSGGAGHVGSMGITDVSPDDRRAIRAEVVRMLREGSYAQVWTEGDPPRWMHRGLSGYVLRRRLHGRARVRPMSGYMSEAGMVTPYRADQLMFGPSESRPRPEGATVIADFESGRSDGFGPAGQGFGRRATRSVNSVFPAVGPVGGTYYYSSAGVRGDLGATGVVRSTPILLPAGGAIELLAGRVGPDDRLGISVVSDEAQIELPIPETHLSMAPVRWLVPEAWGGREVWLELRDESGKAALFVDDIWLVPPPDTPRDATKP